MNAEKLIDQMAMSIGDITNPAVNVVLVDDLREFNELDSKNWTLIFACGSEVHSFKVESDPQDAACELKRKHDWLEGFYLIAAVQGESTILTADSARTSECGLQ
ncbi:MAG: hypothetical protein V4628_11400 [Pseudomonadota bacterium]